MREKVSSKASWWPVTDWLWRNNQEKQPVSKSRNNLTGCQELKATEGSPLRAAYTIKPLVFVVVRLHDYRESRSMKYSCVHHPLSGVSQHVDLGTHPRDKATVKSWGTDL
ncbi:hypothetical protein J6590_032204 [Homalodisca vitripennis]|nr:hypothetical protein J6590_032204 [Homalodisca vitripennis]